MATPLPLPIRVAAGVIALGLEHARRLPEELPEISVTVAGKAMRASMRVQQHITDLAFRGEQLLDEAFSHPSERPSWARFDDEESGDDGVAADDTVTDGDGSDDTAADDTADDDTVADGDGPDDDDESRQVTTPDMPGYDDLRLAQVRARVRPLDSAAITRLLEHERAHQQRASFLTLLSNRLTTLDHDSGSTPP